MRNFRKYVLPKWTHYHTNWSLLKDIIGHLSVTSQGVKDIKMVSCLLVTGDVQRFEESHGRARQWGKGQVRMDSPHSPAQRGLFLEVQGRNYMSC